MRALFKYKAAKLRKKACQAFSSLNDISPIFKILPKDLSDVERADHSISLLLAGIDTLSWSFSWTAGLLAHHPEWAYSTDQETVTAIVSESLRLYPAVWVISRTAVKSVFVEGLEFPAKTRFISPLTILHRHELYWEKPNEFNPGRFLISASRPRMSYAPFGVGGYSCLGLRLAGFAMEKYVGMLNQKYTLMPVGPMPKTRGSVTLTSQKPMFLSMNEK